MAKNTFDFDSYDVLTRKIDFKLRSGAVLKAEYYENYMTEINLKAFDKEQDEAEQAGTLELLTTAYRKHLSLAIAKLPASYHDKEKNVRITLDDSTPEARVEILKRLSYHDLRSMISQLAQDLNRPLDEGETNLSDGPAPKEESAPAQKTDTDS